jgi:hypothetical protein
MEEAALYRSLKGNAWGNNVRLEQERISWNVAWKVLLGVLNKPAGLL